MNASLDATAARTAPHFRRRLGLVSLLTVAVVPVSAGAASAVAPPALTLRGAATAVVGPAYLLQGTLSRAGAARSVEIELQWYAGTRWARLESRTRRADGPFVFQPSFTAAGTYTFRVVAKRSGHPIAASPARPVLVSDPRIGKSRVSPATAGEDGPTSNLRNGAGSQTMDGYLTGVLRDVDGFWSGVFAKSGLPEPYVNYLWPAPGQSVYSKCNGGSYTKDSDAFYCRSDDTIVISQAAATRIWLGQLRGNRDPETGRASGDFSVAFVVAHEYAHSLQWELGYTDRRRYAFSTRAIELHADCWAGAWAYSAYYKGILDGGDVGEAVQAATLLGDYDTSSADHHGTPAQRSAAFMYGYNTGRVDYCTSGYLNGRW